MKKKLCLVLLASLVLMPVTTLFSKSKTTIQWYYDIDAALTAAISEKKPIMVDVYTDWCGWCVKLDNTTYTNKKVTQAAEDFISLKVNPENSEAEQKFAMKYNVTGYPDILFLNENGILINRIGGFLPPKDFLEIMHETLDMADQHAALITKVDNGDLDSAEELLQMYFNSGNIVQAAPLIILLDDNKRLSDEERITYFNSIGYGHIQNGNYQEALTVFKNNIARFTTNDNLYEHNFAAYYIGYSLLMLEKKADAMIYLNEYMDNHEIDSSIRQYFDDLLYEMIS